jgi:hypothetical protein
MSAPTRREMLHELLAIPAAFGLTAPTAKPFEILHNSDLLSEESARGYRRLLTSDAWATRPRNLRIIAGYRKTSNALVSMLRKSVEAGACLLWESPASFVPEGSGTISLTALSVRTLPTRTLAATDSLYVHYSWPQPALIRTFASITSIEAQSVDQPIAFYDGQAVAGIRRMGRGAVVFLGSMLGPHLLAGDPAAEQFCRHLLTTLSFTSL